MKSNFILLFIFLFSIFGFSQTLPVNRYHRTLPILNQINVNTSFAYSLRKLKLSYTGPSIKIRRDSPSSPEGDVAFDSGGIVSGNSIVTITSSGPGLAVGQTLTLNAFIGSGPALSVFVTTWYDQGVNSYYATQTSTGNQPQLVLNSVGIANDKPSILFTSNFPTAASGGDFLVINQPIENIVNQGIRGTFLWALKVTSNVDHYAFGYRNNTTNWRWSFHVNWSTADLFFDSAEVCCATNRSIANGANLNLWKQYTIVRGTSYKTVRRSGVTTSLDNSPATSTTQTGGQFHIGSAFNNTVDRTFGGNISELIMFPTDLSLSDITSLENNQIAFWNL